MNVRVGTDLGEPLFPDEVFPVVEEERPHVRHEGCSNQHVSDQESHFPV